MFLLASKIERELRKSETVFGCETRGRSSEHPFPGGKIAEKVLKI